MQRLHIDIETYSPVSLADSGVYRYAEHPDFRVLLLAYAYGDAPVQVVDLASGEEMPEQLARDIMGDTVQKVAHNATFERVCLGRALGSRLNPMSWECTMVKCAQCGLPLGLGDAAKALDLPVRKMTEGRTLIKLFCTPHPATALHGERTLPEDNPDAWRTFVDYCRMDVEVERSIDQALADYPCPPFERLLYQVDQTINDRGVLIDRPLVDNAVRMDTVYKARLNTEAQQITGLANPNSAAQLREWLGDRIGSQLDSLRKADLPDIAAATDDPQVHRVVQIRAEMAKTSCSKYEAMQSTACKDDRIRGLLQFHGTRTGRWAGRLVQMQNLPQNHLDDIGYARQLLRDDDMDTIALCYGNVPDTLSQLIRTAFIAPPGKALAVCDFSAIEARVLAWLAGEEWVLEVFRGHGKIYEATAAQMYGCQVSDIGKTDPRRQKGKIAVLALGYGGGVGALSAMGGERMGLTHDDMTALVNDWRKANPNIVRLWSAVEEAATRCITSGLPQMTHGLRFTLRKDGAMTITLPSGRLLCYRNMTTATNRFGGPSLKFRGVNSTTKQWGWVETYGGKLTENIVQAIARDCLAHTLPVLSDYQIDIVFHVHDEVVCEVPKDQAAEKLDIIQKVFARPPKWAENLPLKGAGYVTDYYLKD